jgi:hypothetical protein
MCPKCGGRGYANGYFGGKVLRGICSCSSGKAYEKERDKRHKELGLKPELGKRYLKDARRY